MTCALILLSILLVGGCASSRQAEVTYEAKEGKTTFISSKALLGHVSMSGGLAAGQRVNMQAFAACDGRDCTPSEVEIAFLNDSGSDLNLDYRRVHIIADSRELDWEDPLRLSDPPHYSVPRGEFIRVPVQLNDFMVLATARDVEIVFGHTGTSAFRVPFDRRAPLRDFMALMDNSLR